MFYRLFKITVAVVLAIAFLSELSQAAPPFCQNGTSLTCCPLLAHRIASEHHSRCASIVLNNKSGYNIRLVVSRLEDGRWVTSDDSGDIDIDCSPRTDLANGESEVFSSVTSHFLGGISGYVTLIINDNVSTTFAIDWKAPSIGLGSNEYNVDRLPTEDYDVALQHGFDDTVFEVTVTLVTPVVVTPVVVTPVVVP
ncbi:9056_t:CDS:2 [Paraglomus brasilianum]|uniref:9056_t:CDS:1 n=1 Tax=Paraglomus brasilianum TaxID=144538 RepID=A0A9N9DMH5_9GLOM|nr:9056_t:CDS:2 [Paraglomus brasilianum]